MPIRETAHNSGIYTRFNIHADGSDMHAAFMQFAGSHNLAYDHWLDDVETEALEVISHADDDLPAEITAAAKSERWCEAHANRTESAERVLADCKAARLAVDAGDILRAIFHAFQIGMHSEMMHVASREHDAACGAKVHRGSANGSQAIHGSREERQLEYDDWQREITRMMVGDPDISLTEARKRVTRTAPVSYKTVKRHARRPTKDEITSTRTR